MNIEIIEATIEQKPILANLLELYTYDFTEFFDFEIGSNGYYGYEYLTYYWIDSHRYPYLIYVENQLAGFVLIQQGSPISEDKEIWDIAEFFIMRKYRRKKIGSFVALNIWNRFKGRWQLRVLKENKQAYSFWSNAITQFTEKIVIPSEFTIKKDQWLIYHFDSK